MVAIGALVLIATLAWLGVSRYGRYTIIEGTPSGSSRIPERVLDVGVASDGSLVGVVPKSDSDVVHALDVIAWDSTGAFRHLFRLVEPSEMKTPQARGAGSIGPTELKEARLAPIAGRVAALWQSKDGGHYLSTGDARGADSPVFVGFARKLAISPDGAILAIVQTYLPYDSLARG